MASNGEKQKLIGSSPKSKENITIDMNQYGSNDIVIDEDTKLDDKSKSDEDKMDAEFIKQREENIKEIIKTLAGEHEEKESFLASNEGLDIYQLVAFQTYARVEKGYFGEYGFNIFKALVTIFTQIASVTILFYYALDSVKSDSGRGWCDQTGREDMGSYLMAMSYTAFLSLILFSTIKSAKNEGFYQHCDPMEDDEELIEDFVHTGWLSFGRFVNNAVILCAFVLSFVIIFFTDDPMDIILNAVALLFIADIDNMVINSDDYDDVLSWFKERHKMIEEAENDQGDEQEEQTKLESTLFSDLKERTGVMNYFCDCLCILWLCGRCCWFCLQCCVVPMSFCFAIAGPIFVITCY